MNQNKSVSFKDLVQYSNVVGSVRVRGVNLQLCDYVECLENNQWYAAAHCNDTHNMNEDFMTKTGVKIKTLSGYGKNKKEFQVAYVPESLLTEAKPQYQDAHLTEQLITRLKKKLLKLNAQNQTQRQAV